MRTRRFILVASLLAAASAHAEITYTATLETMNKLRIEMAVPIRSAETTFQLPNFAPGHYVLLTSPRDVSEVSATGPEGLAYGVEKVDENSYRVKTPTRGILTFRYAKTARPADGALLWQGPYEYMYVVGRKEEACRLLLRGPQGCKFATALDPVASKADMYTAPNYDVLADAPVAAGDLLFDGYTVRGKPHSIVLYGAVKNEIDRPYLREVCSRLTEAQGRMFGDLPYKRYVWLFRVFDGEAGGGGLEHLNSTNISFASGLGPGTVGLLSHEFFHLWNVKRIRSKPLGPFDYLSIPKTGALWWLEGVTDYYASVFTVRSGLLSEQDFWNDLVDNVRTTRRNERRFEISPYDASFRVGEAANGRGNSAGFGVNYYNTGWVAGLCLDAELRHRTAGRHSLDDVMRALYAHCRDGRPGFEEDEIRKQLIRFGGPEMGPVYDSWIMKPGELPVEDQLAKLGYRFARRTVRTVVPPYNAVVAKASQAMRIVRVNPAAASALKVDDLIVAANGVPCGFRTYREILVGYRNGLGALDLRRPIRLTVKRDGQTIEAAVDPIVASTEDFAVDPLVETAARFAEARRGWLGPNP